MNGIIVIDKPAGWTSHDVVGRVRRLCGERRVGHSGTLDPMATGVLPVFIGRATRAVSFVEGVDKTYEAGIRFGLTTDTQDITGAVLEENECHVLRPQFEEIAAGFVGESDQLPPMYSAKKVDGKKLYELARKGKEVERKPVHIKISSVEVTGGEENDFTFTATVSKGTYIRTICHDMGQKAGCGAVMSSLRRTVAGSYNIGQAVTLERLEAAAENGTIASLLMPTDSVFAAFPAVTIDMRDERRCRVGAEFAAELPDGKYRVYSEGGEFLMFGRVRENIMSTIKNFFEV